MRGGVNEETRNWMPFESHLVQVEAGLGERTQTEMYSCGDIKLFKDFLRIVQHHAPGLHSLYSGDDYKSFLWSLTKAPLGRVDSYSDRVSRKLILPCHNIVFKQGKAFHWEPMKIYAEKFLEY